MKKKNNIMLRVSVLGLFSLFFFWPQNTEAQTNIQAQLRIESPAQHIVQKTLTLEADCEISDAASSSTLTYSGNRAICALEQARSSALLSYQVTASSFGLFLDSINEIANASDFSEFWIVRHNNKLAEVGISDLDLNDGDELLLTYGPWDMDPLRVELSTSSVQVGNFIDISILNWSDESNSFAPKTDTTSTSIRIGTEIYEITSSSLSWQAQNAGTFPVYIEQENKTRSASISLLVAEAPPTPEITLKITSGLDEIVKTNLSLTEDCMVIDSTSSTFSFSASKAICALNQASELELVDYQVTASSFGLFLDSINEIANASDFSEFWIVRHNNKLAEVGISDLELSDGDELLLTYGPWDMDPLKLEISATSTEIGEPIEIFALLWSDENNVFEPYFGAVNFYINATPIESASGTLAWTPDTSGAVSIFASGNGKTRSQTILMAVLAQTADQGCTTCGNSVAQPPQTNSQGGQTSNTVSNSKSVFNLESALNFLISQQKADGSFGSSTLYTDWTAISFASHALGIDSKARLKTYLLSNPSPFTGINKLADFERRAMALMALGINSYSGSNLDYIEQIVSGFDGAQFGDLQLVNDDIFALLVLNKAGYQNTESMMTKTADFIMSQQTAGSWGSVDMTAAGIQALSAFTGKAGVPEALASARSYLAAQQGADGGFGNIYSSSWAIQGIVALGEDPNLWTKNNSNPLEYLATQQSADGGMLGSENLNNRIWATAYAIPASQKKTWVQLLSSFSKPESSNQNNAGNATQNGTGGSPIQNIESNTSTGTKQTDIQGQIIEKLISGAKSLLGEKSIALDAQNQVNQTSGQEDKQEEKATDSLASLSPEAVSGSNPSDFQNVLKRENSNQTQTTTSSSIDLEAENQDQNSQNIEKTKETTEIAEPEPLKARVVKKIFNSALVATLSLGAFIGWRLIRTLV